MSQAEVEVELKIQPFFIEIFDQGLRREAITNDFSLLVMNNKHNLTSNSNENKKDQLRERKSKMSSLSLCLKNEILCFIEIDEIFKNIFWLNKSFLKALKYSKIYKCIHAKIKTFQMTNSKYDENYEKEFEINNIKNLKDSLFKDYSNFSSEIKETQMNKIISYLFCHKFKQTENLKIMHFKNFIYDWSILANFIAYKTNLNKLNLTYSKLGEKGNLEIITLLNLSNLKKKEIKEIYLNSNFLGRENNEAFFLLSKGISQLSKIQKLDLSNNEIGASENCMKLLAEVLIMKDCPSFKYLNIASCEVGVSDKGLLHLADALSVNKNIENLILSYNHLGRSEIYRNNFFESLITNKRLLVLNLSNNALSAHEKVEYCLSKFLKFNGTIRELYLNNNNLGKSHDELNSLFNSLAENKSLMKIYMENNNIGANEKHLRYLAKAIKANETLKEIYLMYNYLGRYRDSFIYFCKRLFRNKSLEKLDISFNNFSSQDKSLAKLFEILKEISSKTLKEIKLSKVEPEEKRLFDEYMKMHLQEHLKNVDIKINYY